MPFGMQVKRREPLKQIHLSEEEEGKYFRKTLKMSDIVEALTKISNDFYEHGRNYAIVHTTFGTFKIKV